MNRSSSSTLLVSLLLGLSSFVAACEPPPPESDDSSLNGEDDDTVVSALAQGQDGGARVRVPSVVAKLQEATQGLLFMSESDYPLDVLYWKHPGGVPTAVAVARLTEHEGEVVEERTAKAFFEGATRIEDWQTPEEQATARRYRELVALLKSKLTHLRVYRFGQIQIHAFVVGMTRAGDWVALSTVQIET